MRRIKMGLFSKRDPESLINKHNTYYCPFCGKDLGPIIDEQAEPVYQVFANMGPLASSVTMQTARDQFIYQQGIDCPCGKHVKPINK